MPAVRIRREFLQRLGADALRGRVGRLQLRMGGFEFDQFAQERVVLGIGDIGIVLPIVAIVGIVYGRAQLRGSLCRLHERLRAETTWMG